MPAIPPPVHTDAEVVAWFETVVLLTQEVWVSAARDGSLGGLLVLDRTWLEQLYVHPDHTGRGIGSELVRFAQASRDALELWTFQANAGARRFYERHGFVAAETTEGDNEEGAPDVRYVSHRV